MRGESSLQTNEAKFSLKREWRIFLVFLLLGPPIGGLAFLLLQFLVLSFKHGLFYLIDESYRFQMKLIGIFLTASYFFGFLQAAIVGLFALDNFSKYRILRLIPLLKVPFFISAFLILFELIILNSRLTGGNFVSKFNAFIFMLYIHCAATFGCWLLLSRLRLPPIEEKQGA